MWIILRNYLEILEEVGYWVSKFDGKDIESIGSEFKIYLGWVGLIIEDLEVKIGRNKIGERLG